MTPMYTSAAEIDFNSQPHKEADNTIMFYYIHTNISTHSLTRRLTIKPFSLSANPCISTHSLTRRLTYFLTE